MPDRDPPLPAEKTMTGGESGGGNYPHPDDTMSADRSQGGQSHQGYSGTGQLAGRRLDDEPESGAEANAVTKN